MLWQTLKVLHKLALQAYLEEEIKVVLTVCEISDRRPPGGVFGELLSASCSVPGSFGSQAAPGRSHAYMWQSCASPDLTSSHNPPFITVYNILSLSEDCYISFLLKLLPFSSLG